ncbi:zinc metalloprotease HtpX, partial [Candidatus Shapirobacteria bacterium CG10_big_fil_rev_8_21_14_0_10_48_15]
MLNVYEQVDRNKRCSLVVILAFGLFVVFIVWLLGQISHYSGSTIGLALIISGLISFSGYWWSDKIILTISRARPASRERDFQFF